MFLWWKKNVAMSTLEILVASEVEDEGSHELVIQLWVHPFLAIGESSGEYHRLFIPIICTCHVIAASGWIIVLLPVRGGLVLSMDRTNWKFGELNISLKRIFARLSNPTDVKLL